MFLYVGNCLELVDVKVSDSRDNLNRSRFFPLTLDYFVFGKENPEFWFWSLVYYPTKLVNITLFCFFAIVYYIIPNYIYIYFLLLSFRILIIVQIMLFHFIILHLTKCMLSNIYCIIYGHLEYLKRLIKLRVVNVLTEKILKYINLN